jgi:phage tail protein X
MKKISFWLFLFAFAIFMSGVARAQDSATQQQMDQINGRIQDILDAQAQQTKRLDALEKQMGDLQDKLNQPGATSSASADDLKKLAEQVREIDKKRQDDNEKILQALEKLGKGGGGSTPGRKPSVSTAPSTSTDNSTPNATGPQKGYDYPIANGDTIAAIAKAYRAQGVKVTTSQILAANPGLDPKNLIVGKKIFIPDPNAK